MRRAPRGQAATEFALGLLVFVTVLLFGIHFAELGYLGTKVHEAEAAAVWDSTAYRSYQFGIWADSGPIAAVAAQTNTTQRYADWDGRASANGTAPTLAVSRAEPMVVNCTRAGMTYPLPALAPTFFEAGDVRCGAEGDVNAFRVPRSFADGADGFFKAAHKGTTMTNPMHLCGSGRPLGTGCPGKLSILLGDYALTADQNENGDCALQTSSPNACANQNFYRTTRGTFDKSMQLTARWAEGWTGFPERWTRNIVTGLPRGRITGFYMSFRGEQTGFVEPVEQRLGGGRWQSSPMDAWMPLTPYRTAYTAKSACQLANGYCFLGRYPCN